jgi:hypothetical protein
MDARAEELQACIMNFSIEICVHERKILVLFGGWCISNHITIFIKIFLEVKQIAHPFVSMSLA